MKTEFISVIVKTFEDIFLINEKVKKKKTMMTLHNSVKVKTSEELTF